MFTIKQAAHLVGVPQATLRTWERRYAVVAPPRTGGGYRLYDAPAIAALTAMRRLVASGWAPSTAARAILDGDVRLDDPVAGRPPMLAPDGAVASCTEEFLAAAIRLDPQGLDACLDRGLSIGSFEHAVDIWLFPTLVALGERWDRGEIDVAGEHLASHHVLRRLSAAFDAAGSRHRGPKVVVGLPADSRHELGALAFATALRRLGLDVLYLGPDVPERSWLAAVERHDADAAVLAVVTESDRPTARTTARALTEAHPKLLVAFGGVHGTASSTHVHALPQRIGDAADELDELLERQLSPLGSKARPDVNAD